MISRLSVIFLVSVAFAANDISRFVHDAADNEKARAESLRLLKLHDLVALRKVIEGEKSAVIRNAIYYAIVGYALKSKSTTNRQEIVHFLLRMAPAEDKHQIKIFRLMLSFKKSDFNEHALVLLGELPKRWPNNFFYPTEVRLMGVAGMRSMIPTLQSIASQESDRGSWAAHVALASMGVPGYLEQMSHRIKAEPDLFERRRMLKDLASTKQQKAFDVIRTYLYSTELVPGGSDYIGAKENYETVRILRDTIRNFPKTDEIGEIIKWAEKQKAWQIK